MNTLRGLTSKSIFLVGQYEKENPFDLEQIRKEYRIPKEKIGAVPYNIDLRMAAGRGKDHSVSETAII